MKAAIASILLVFVISSLPAQCPGKDFLWHRIVFLRDSSTATPAQQLNELTAYEKKIVRCGYYTDSCYALLLQRIGWLYTTKNDFLHAVQYNQKCISLINGQKNNPAINPVLALKCYWNLHLMYDSLKLESKNMAAIDSCMSHAIAQDNYDYQLGCLWLKVPYLFATGDYFGCVRYATLAESITRKTSATALEYENKSLEYFSWKINGLSFLHRSDEAEKMIAGKISFAENNHLNGQLATLYGLLATELKEKGEASKAINYFKKSYHYNLLLKYTRGCVEALNNIGFTYATSLNQNKIALTYYFKALHFADKNETLNIFDNIANIYVQNGKYDSAFFFFQKAFDQLKPGCNEAGLLKSSNTATKGEITEYVTGMVLDKANAWFMKYKTTGNNQALKECLTMYKTIDRYFDVLKAYQSEIQSKLFWKANNRRLYDQAIEACYLDQNAEMAFYFFEKSRSALLNDQIREQQRMNNADIAKQAQIKNDLLAIEQQLQNTSSSSKEYITLQQQQVIKEQQLQIILTDSNPSFAYRNNLADTAALTLDLVKKNILDPKRSLVEIFNGDSAVYILAVSVNATSFIQLNKHLYDSLSTAFISFVADPARLNKDFAGFANVSHKLCQLIFQQTKIQTGGSLIISPDGVNYPFEALLLNNDVRNPDYLVSHYATSYTYSVRYLTNRFTNNSKGAGSMLGVAPVLYKNYKNLVDLTGSDNSLKSISNYFTNPTNYLFGEATKNNFLKNFTRYNVIQLYTHAADSSSNNDPVIYFADSAMYLSALIPDRQPVTQLVILSACETANGKLYKGEGIFSFNRGFAALGIPAAVSNLWSVENQSTYRITELFHKYLSQGLPTDVALQQAKLAFINSSTSKEKTLPWFWAGSILTGKVNTIKTKSDSRWVIMLASALLLLAIGFIALRAKRKSTSFLVRA